MMTIIASLLLEVAVYTTFMIIRILEEVNKKGGRGAEPNYYTAYLQKHLASPNVVFLGAWIN